METAQKFPRYRLTVKDFEKMGKAGIFKEDDRIELVEGDLIEMAPIGQKHLGVVVWLDRAFNAALRASSALVSVQNPIQLGKRSELYPDIAILQPRDDFYIGKKPTPDDVLLVIEVADATLQYDRETKIPLYARHKIPEVWLIDLQDKQVEIYVRPSKNRYQQILKPDRTERLSLSTMPGISIDLAQLWELLSY